MQLHVEFLAGQQMLARMMEMELQQLEARAVDHRLAALGAVHLDGMAVVQHDQRHVVEARLYRPDIGAHGAAQIDRRLLHAEIAGAEIRLQLTPFRRRALALIAPMGRVAGGGLGLPPAAAPWARLRGQGRTDRADARGASGEKAKRLPAGNR